MCDAGVASRADLGSFDCRYRPGLLEVRCQVRDAQGDMTRFEFPGRDLSESLQHAAIRFSELHGYPEPARAAYRRPPRPEASCIVVVHRNEHFVRELMIPSLVRAAGGRAIEIIVVCNGGNFELPGEIECIRVDSHSVAHAYNVGLASARAPLVALFHDDCLLDDPAWLDKFEAARSAGADAVSPEVRHLERFGEHRIKPLPVLKNVPLVAPRAVFESVGDYDETLLIGYEDLDMTLRLLDAGYRTARVPIGYRHFGGMSSCLKYLDYPRLDLLFATLAVPARTILEAFASFSGDPGSRPAAMLAAMNARQLCAVLVRHAHRLEVPAETIQAWAAELIDAASVRSGLTRAELSTMPLTVLDDRASAHGGDACW